MLNKMTDVLIITPVTTIINALPLIDYLKFTGLMVRSQYTPAYVVSLNGLPIYRPRRLSNQRCVLSRLSVTLRALICDGLLIGVLVIGLLVIRVSDLW